MPGIPREVIEHHLKIHPDAKPVSQKPRRQSVERQDFIRKEVQKLLDAGFIEEVHHPVWLANPVIVPKANGKLRMCIDYTSLNKACPKDPYPLPRIDQIVDSTSGCDAGLHPKGGPEAARRRLHRRGSSPSVAGQPSHRPQGEWEASDVHRLHQP